VIAGDEVDGGGGEECEKGVELIAMGGDGEGAVDDVAKEDDLGWLVVASEGGEAVEGIIRGRDGEEVAGVALCPRVAEVEIGDDECAIGGKPEGAAGIEEEPGGELVGGGGRAGGVTGEPGWRWFFQ
jgi:hypothetical protein